MKRFFVLGFLAILVAAGMCGCVEEGENLKLNLYDYLKSENLVPDKPIKIHIVKFSGITMVGGNEEVFELFNSARILRYSSPASLVADVRYQTISGTKVKRVSLSLKKTPGVGVAVELWFNPPEKPDDVIERSEPIEIALAPMFGVEVSVQDKDIKLKPATWGKIKASR